MKKVSKFISKLENRDFKCDKCGETVKPVIVKKTEEKIVIKFECEKCGFNMKVKSNTNKKGK